MNLLTTSKLSLLATVTKLLSTLVINKAVAIFVGPTGLALLGQFQNFTQICLTFSRAGINSGVTKYVAERQDVAGGVSSVLSAAIRITAVCSLVISALLIIFAEHLSFLIFSNEDFRSVFVLFGVAIFLASLNGLLLSVLNGLKEIKTWTRINIIQSIYGLGITTLLIYWYELHGALIAMVTNQAIVTTIIFWILRKHSVITYRNFRKKVDPADVSKLLRFSVMTLTSAATVPISLMLIRDQLITTVGTDAAGYWQGVTHLSSLYLLVVTTVLTTYYLPRYSEINDRNLIRYEIFKGYRTFIPLIIITSIVIYLFRIPLIGLLFSENFLPMADLIAIQLIGSFLKILSWFYSFLMVAKAMTKKFIISEIFSSVFLVFSSFYLVDSYGVIGACYAYIITYFVYFFLAMLMTKEHWMARE